MDVHERFWRRVDKSGDCWVWTGPLQQGYGSISVGGKGWLVHRWSYTVFIAPIDPGMSIDHLCSNRACVRPSHLEMVTIGENARRAASRPRPNARREPRGGKCFRGHGLNGALRCAICLEAKREHRRQLSERMELERRMGGGVK